MKTITITKTPFRDRTGTLLTELDTINHKGIPYVILKLFSTHAVAVNQISQHIEYLSPAQIAFSDKT